MRSAARTAVVLALLGVAACGTDAAEQEGEELAVFASFYPLQYVAEEIGGDAVAVTNLTPPGSDPHHLELAPATVQQLDGAPMVVYLSGLQPAVDEAIAATNPERVVDATAAADVHGADPHFWLDPLRLADVADHVAAALAQADGPQGADYEQDERELRQRLEALDADFRSELAQCRGAVLVSTHESYGYLAMRYDLQQVGIAGIDTEAEPSPARLREVGQIIEAEGVRTLFYDDPAAARVVESLAEEFGVTAAHLDPLEKQLDPTRDYAEVMTDNLAVLSAGLNCDG